MATIFTDATIKFDINRGYTMTIMDMPDSGTWELNEDGTKLILDKGTAAEVVHGLTTLTSDVLEYTESLEEDGTGNFELTYRWVK